MIKTITFIILAFLSANLFAFELVIIQGISRQKQTFITRKGKKDGIFEGKKATFTSDNVSIIAKAISVNRDFTQWEILNDFTEVPFQSGEIVTYYDTKEYLWALAPEEVSAKYIKNEIFRNKESIGIHTFLTQTLSESVSGVDDAAAIRGGTQVELYYERELNEAWAWAGGARYTQENIQVTDATISTQRFLGMLDLRYRFPVMKDFYKSKVGLSIGFGIGQSLTKADGITSSGLSQVLPSTKMSFYLPIDNKSELVFEGGLESINVEEEFENGQSQTTTMSNIKFGLAFKRYLGI